MLRHELCPVASRFRLKTGYCLCGRSKQKRNWTRIREGFRLVTIGHDAGRKAVRLGQREIDVWTEVQTAVEREAGRWMQMGNDCIVGHRPANMSAAPLDFEIISNDSFILDISVVVDGYWTDSCATYYAERPTAQQGRNAQIRRGSTRLRHLTDSGPAL